LAGYVPGYRLKQRVQIMAARPGEPLHTLLPEGSAPPLYKVSVYLEVEGAADYLPAYAGNLDIMTSAAVRVAARLAEQRVAEVVR
jgi:acetaldehyde dehydrogenase